MLHGAPNPREPSLGGRVAFVAALCVGGCAVGVTFDDLPPDNGSVSSTTGTTSSATGSAPTGAAGGSGAGASSTGTTVPPDLRGTAGTGGAAGEGSNAAGTSTDAGVSAGAGGTGGEGGTGGSGGSAGASGSGGSGGNGGTGGADACPNDPDKTAPGDCGCGEPDTDSDDDGEPDCDDECPMDPDKTEVGDCGCGVDDAVCLVNRYDFEGTGSTATDVISGMDGMVVGGAQAGGDVTLAGGMSDQYVELPAGILTAWESVTIEAWVTWSLTTTYWQRLFDFGDNDGAGAGTQGPNGDGYVFMTPSTDTDAYRVAISDADYNSEEFAVHTDALPADTMTHVAAVIDGPGGTLTIYLDGVDVDSTNITLDLSDIQDDNCWIGRSQYEQDPNFGGVVHEFRIYGVARTDAQLAASFAAGPDAVPTQ